MFALWTDLHPRGTGLEEVVGERTDDVSMDIDYS